MLIVPLAIEGEDRGCHDGKKLNIVDTVYTSFWTGPEAQHAMRITIPFTVEHDPFRTKPNDLQTQVN
jgi:hypothetical protein